MDKETQETITVNKLIELLLQVREAGQGGAEVEIYSSVPTTSVFGYILGWVRLKNILLVHTGSNLLKPETSDGYKVRLS